MDKQKIKIKGKNTVKSLIPTRQSKQAFIKNLQRYGFSYRNYYFYKHWCFLYIYQQWCGRFLIKKSNFKIALERRAIISTRLSLLWCVRCRARSKCTKYNLHCIHYLRIVFYWENLYLWNFQIKQSIVSIENEFVKRTLLNFQFNFFLS